MKLFVAYNKRLNIAIILFTKNLLIQSFENFEQGWVWCVCIDYSVVAVEELVPIITRPAQRNRKHIITEHAIGIMQQMRKTLEGGRLSLLPLNPKLPVSNSEKSCGDMLSFVSDNYQLEESEIGIKNMISFKFLLTIFDDLKNINYQPTWVLGMIKRFAQTQEAWIYLTLPIIIYICFLFVSCSYWPQWTSSFYWFFFFEDIWTLFVDSVIGELNREAYDLVLNNTLQLNTNISDNFNPVCRSLETLITGFQMFASYYEFTGSDDYPMEIILKMLRWAVFMILYVSCR